jgi:N-carbamoylputrescine amidase
MAAIVSGSFVLSSNRRGGDVCFGGCGLVISPDGDVIARTSENEPFVTVEIDISESIKAKKTYPRYLPE